MNTPLTSLRRIRAPWSKTGDRSRAVTPTPAPVSVTTLVDLARPLPDPRGQLRAALRALTRATITGTPDQVADALLGVAVTASTMAVQPGNDDQVVALTDLARAARVMAQTTAPATRRIHVTPPAPARGHVVSAPARSVR